MHSQEVEVIAGSARLRGVLTLPTSCLGIVVFAHGMGSGRRSPRNQYIADRLNERSIGTLLFDLLSATEGHEVFQIPLLSKRLVLVTRWLLRQPEVRNVPVGYLGSSTGAAAALWAAAQLGRQITCVVSRGGRPDLALPKLKDVSADVLLIVGGEDLEVLRLNRDALKVLRSARIHLIPFATHLFEEPGALEQVALLCSDYFVVSFSGLRRQSA